MEIVKKQITTKELKRMANNMFGNLVKAAVDVKNEIMAVDGELHADEEVLLTENGSRGENIWGINIYPEVQDEEWIEFDSMINLKPALGNKTRGVEDEEIRKKIVQVVNKLVAR